MVVSGVWITAGPCDEIAGHEPLEIVDVRRCEPTGGLHEDVAPADQRGLRVGTVERGDFDAGTLHQAAGGEAEHGHFNAGGAIGGALAELALVEGFEVRHQAAYAIVVQAAAGRDRRRHLVHLAAVAQVDRPVQRDGIVGEALGRQLLAGASHHRRVDVVDLVGRTRRRQCLGHGVFVDDVGGEEAKGGVHRGGVGDHDAPDPKLRAEHAAEQAAAAAEGVQHEIARVEAALDRDLVDEIGNLRRGDAVDADGGVLDAHAERRGNLSR